MRTNLFNTLAFLLLTATAFNASFATAQESDTTNRSREKWVESMSSLLNGKLAVTDQAETFSVNTPGYRLRLRPNTSTTFKFSFNYRFISFGLHYAPAFIPGNHDDAIKGETDNIGFSTSLISSHWYSNIAYSRNKGYYVRNTSDFDPTWKKGDPYLLVPELEVNSFEGSTGYSFNEKFSIRSLTTQTERQLKSAGTVIPEIAYRLYYINNLQAQSGQKTRNFECTLGAGYYYTFVHRERLYASIGATASAGYIFTKLTTRTAGATEDVTGNSNAAIGRVKGRTAIGYNGARFFAGALLELSDSRHNQKNTTATNTEATLNYEVFIGYRLAAPRVLSKLVDRVLMTGKRGKG